MISCLTLIIVENILKYFSSLSKNKADSSSVFIFKMRHFECSTKS